MEKVLTYGLASLVGETDDFIAQVSVLHTLLVHL